MAKEWLKQHRFNTGEVTTELFGRDDLDMYYSAAEKMTNMFPQPTGAATKRSGLRMVAEVPEAAAGVRASEFVFSNDQRYLFVLLDGLIRVFHDDAATADVVTPWSAAQVTNLNWTQFADTWMGFHTEVEYRRVMRQGGHDLWAVEELPVVNIPGYHFGRATLGSGISDDRKTVDDGGDGVATISSTEDDFADAEPGWYVAINAGLLRVKTKTDNKHVVCDLIQSLVDKTTAAPGTWWVMEPTWSDARGWPASAAFHKNRLGLFGGSRPTAVALSTARDPFDFDVGNAFDDDAVVFNLLGRSMDEIYQAASANDHLVMLSAAGEWILTTEVVTPETPGATSFSGYGAANVPPVLLDSGLMFVGNPETGQNQVLEVAWSENGLSTNTEVVSMLAPHLIGRPVALAARRGDGERSANHVFVVNAEGSVAVVVSLKKQNVTGWASMVTEGAALAGAVLGQDAYFVIKRTIAGVDRYFLEVLDRDHFLDCSLRVVNPAPALVHAGFDHLDGHMVKVVADGYTVGDQMVTDGEVTTPFAATTVEAGLGWSWELKTLPAPSAVLKGKSAQLARFAKASIDLDNSVGVHVNGRRIISRRLGSELLDQPPPRVSGKHEVTLLGGWSAAPSLRIHGDEPGPVVIRAVQGEVQI